MEIHKKLVAHKIHVKSFHSKSFMDKSAPQMKWRKRKFPRNNQSRVGHGQRARGNHLQEESQCLEDWVWLEMFCCFIIYSGLIKFTCLLAVMRECLTKMSKKNLTVWNLLTLSLAGQVRSLEFFPILFISCRSSYKWSIHGPSFYIISSIYTGRKKNTLCQNTEEIASVGW